MTLCRVEDSRRRCLGMHEWAEEWAEEWIGWLSRFKLILLRRISLATLHRYGLMGGRRNGYQYILLPASGRGFAFAKQGN